MHFRHRRVSTCGQWSSNVMWSDLGTLAISSHGPPCLPSQQTSTQIRNRTVANPRAPQILEPRAQMARDRIGGPPRLRSLGLHFPRQKEGAWGSWRGHPPLSGARPSREAERHLHLRPFSRRVGGPVLRRTPWLSDQVDYQSSRVFSLTFKMRLSKRAVLSPIWWLTETFSPTFSQNGQTLTGEAERKRRLHGKTCLGRRISIPHWRQS